MMKFFAFSLTLFSLFTQTLAANLELGAPFRDNMILQRGVAVPVWGIGKAGETVTVKFAGQTKTTIVDKKNNWQIKLDPLKASFKDRNFSVSVTNSKSIDLKGVLVGEVWFSSGQSNMVWTAGRSMCGDIAKEIASSKEELPIREINISTVSALYPQKRAESEKGAWKRSRDASGFSALSLSFAYELYKELKVPIGILLSAHSNTRIEAFTQRQAIEKHSELEGDKKLMHDADPTLEQGRKAFEQYYQDILAWQKKAGEITAKGGDRIPNQPKLPGIAGMWRGPSQFFNGKISPVVPYAVKGAIWCQGTSNSGDGRIYAYRMEALINGWRDAWSMPNMPFYFTQMQCYGSPNPDNVGFADIRQVQHQFFINNRKNVGMVVQSDLNSARPQGIHYFNKLHPGMRMARWALAKDYGKNIPYTGPIFQGYAVKGSKVIVSFEKESLFGGLMIANKGMAKDYRTPGKFVEPARATPGDKLNHFRVCGEDKKWVTASAKIVGNTVIVESKEVSKPIGVQYAYSSVPENSNLYNKAGLPATPFAMVNHKFIFEEDDLEKAAALKSKYARYTDPNYPVFKVAAFYRDGAIIQRDKPIKVWGFANKGVKVDVVLDKTKKSTVANELQQWSMTLPALKASTKPITMEIKASHGHSRSIKNILVGDLWYLTGSTLLNSESAYDRRDKNAKLPETMPLVREFRRKTKASTSTKPRKRDFETGGGKYRSSWLTADYAGGKDSVMMFAYHFAKTLNRDGVPQGFITMSAGTGGRHGSMSSPLSWTSFNGVKNLKNPIFQARMNQLLLQFPNSDIAKKAVTGYISDVKLQVNKILEANQKEGGLMNAAPLAFPAFPSAGRGGDVKPDMIPTYTYNWCVSPLTPVSVAGVIWIPSEFNIGYTPKNYGLEMEIYAKSLVDTYGQAKIDFYYAQPSGQCVEGIGTPNIPGAKSLEFDSWPKSLKNLAIGLAKLAK